MPTSKLWQLRHRYRNKVLGLVCQVVGWQNSPDTSTDDYPCQDYRKNDQRYGRRFQHVRVRAKPIRYLLGGSD
jgi:hypothetical protein